MLVKIKDNKYNSTPKICCICNNEITTRPNNAEPYKKGICCDECNKKFVIPARINQMMNKNK